MKKRYTYIGILVLMMVMGIFGTVRAAETVQQPTPTEMQKVEYTLPYPGMLPSSPLYFVKRFRDFILEKLIAEPVKKAEFYTLQGDKRLQMGIMLTEQKNTALAETTISKAEKYMEQSVNTLANYETSGIAIPKYVAEKLTTALRKHQEVIQGLLQTANAEQKNGLSESLGRVQQLLERVKELKTTD